MFTCMLELLSLYSHLKDRDADLSRCSRQEDSQERSALSKGWLAVIYINLFITFNDTIPYIYMKVGLLLDPYKLYPDLATRGSTSCTAELQHIMAVWKLIRILSNTKLYQIKYFLTLTFEVSS